MYTDHYFVVDEMAKESETDCVGDDTFLQLFETHKHALLSIDPTSCLNEDTFESLRKVRELTAHAGLHKNAEGMDFCETIVGKLTERLCALKIPEKVGEILTKLSSVWKNEEENSEYEAFLVEGFSLLKNIASSDKKHTQTIVKLEIIPFARKVFLECSITRRLHVTIVSFLNSVISELEESVLLKVNTEFIYQMLFVLTRFKRQLLTQQSCSQSLLCDSCADIHESTTSVLGMFATIFKFKNAKYMDSDLFKKIVIVLCAIVKDCLEDKIVIASLEALVSVSDVSYFLPDFVTTTRDYGYASVICALLRHENATIRQKATLVFGNLLLTETATDTILKTPILTDILSLFYCEDGDRAMFLVSNISLNGSGDLLSTVYLFDLIPYTVFCLKSNKIRVVINSLLTITNLVCKFKDTKYKERLLAHDKYGIVEAIMPFFDADHFTEPQPEEDEKREALDLISDTLSWIHSFLSDLLSEPDEAQNLIDAQKYDVPIKLIHEALQRNDDEMFEDLRERFNSLSAVLKNIG